MERDKTSRQASPMSTQGPSTLIAGLTALRGPTDESASSKIASITFTGLRESVLHPPVAAAACLRHPGCQVGLDLWCQTANRLRVVERSSFQLSRIESAFSYPFWDLLKSATKKQKKH